MEDFEGNIFFLRAAFGGEIQFPEAMTNTAIISTGDSSSSSKSKKNKKETPRPRKQNASHCRFEDQLILKSVQLKRRDWRAVLAFLKTNWEVLGKDGQFYRDCDIGERSIQDRL